MCFTPGGFVPSIYNIMKSKMLRWNAWASSVLCSFAISISAQSHSKLAQEILDATGVQGGLILHIGSGDGQLTQALRANEHFMVHGLDSNATHVQTAREAILANGQYGSITIDHLTGTELPIVDNLINLVVS